MLSTCSVATSQTISQISSSKLTREMLSVHSGQRATSAIGDHTSECGAAISVVMLKRVRVIALGT